MRVSTFPINVKKIIHWDPAFDTSATKSRTFENSGDIFYMNNGKNIQISHQMHNELIENPWMELLQKRDKQHFIIFAGKHNKIANKSETDTL